jgi:hypothetical protein
LVALPEPATLAKLVSTDGAQLLGRLAAVAAWVTDAGQAGRTVDERGEARRPDRPALLAALDLPHDATPGAVALTRWWRLAIDFDVVQLRHSRAVPGPGAALVAAALAGDTTTSPEPIVDLWCDLADALLDPPAPPTGPKGMTHLRDWLRPWAPRLLNLLHTTTAGADSPPADLDTLTDQLIEDNAHQLPPGDPDLFASLAAAAIGNIVADLAQHGALTLTGPTNHADVADPAAAKLGTATSTPTTPPGLTVNLTDLGRYLVHHRIAAANSHP